MLSQPQRRNIWGGGVHRVYILHGVYPERSRRVQNDIVVGYQWLVIGGWLSFGMRPACLRRVQPATGKGLLGGVAPRTINPAEKAATVNTINAI